jgi:hypothetical protein
MCPRWLDWEPTDLIPRAGGLFRKGQGQSEKEGCPSIVLLESRN